MHCVHVKNSMHVTTACIVYMSETDDQTNLTLMTDEQANVMMTGRSNGRSDGRKDRITEKV